VTRSFASNTVLNECDLVVESGLIHGLVGPGGAGKTVLLKTMTTLLPPDDGRVSLFGDEVVRYERNALRAFRNRIGMQFQNLALFDFLDVFDNVAFPLVMSLKPPPDDEIEKRVNEALASVGLPETARLKLHELSGGMQRRVAFARAIAGDAELIVFDDPTGGLDPVTSSRIFDLISRLHDESGTTMVIATHDVDRLKRICDDFHVVVDGKVLFEGSMEEGMLADDGEVRRFLSPEEETN